MPTDVNRMTALIEDREIDLHPLIESEKNETGLSGTLVLMIESRSLHEPLLC